jgi:hypothetical protein
MAHLNNGNELDNLLETLCIRVPKVYDWVNRQVDIPLLTFMGPAGLAQLGFDCEGVTGGVEDPCAVLGDSAFTVNCFVTDSLGNPVDPTVEGSLVCTEIIQPGGRLEITATLPDGETVTLQKVKALVKGFVVVEVSDLQGNTTCTSDPIPFATAQTFFLCAPEGTELNCHVSFFECDANLMCTNGTFQQLDVSITICLDAQMEANVKLEIEGKFCSPRAELVAGVCPINKFPPQCPAIFPGNA